MTIHEFEKLTYLEQEEKVADYGIYITNYNDGDMMCDVYKLFNFFVNFKYDLRYNETPIISAILETENFRLYLNGQFPFSHN